MHLLTIRVAYGPAEYHEEDAQSFANTANNSSARLCCILWGRCGSFCVHLCTVSLSSCAFGYAHLRALQLHLQDNDVTPLQQILAAGACYVYTSIAMSSICYQMALSLFQEWSKSVRYTTIFGLLFHSCRLIILLAGQHIEILYLFRWKAQSNLVKETQF